MEIEQDEARGGLGQGVPEASEAQDARWSAASLNDASELGNSVIERGQDENSGAPGVDHRESNMDLMDVINKKVEMYD